MLLEIDDWRSVGDLQYRFNKCFPNLNLLVYDAKDTNHQETPQASGVLLEHLRKGHQHGVLSIKSWFTKTQVEALLLGDFGLATKIVPLEGILEFSRKDSGKLPLSELNQMAAMQKVERREIAEDPDEFVEGWSRKPEPFEKG